MTVVNFKAFNCISLLECAGEFAELIFKFSKKKALKATRVDAITKVSVKLPSCIFINSTKQETNSDHLLYILNNTFLFATTEFNEFEIDFLLDFEPFLGVETGVDEFEVNAEPIDVY